MIAALHSGLLQSAASAVAGRVSRLPVVTSKSNIAEKGKLYFVEWLPMASQSHHGCMEEKISKMIDDKKNQWRRGNKC